MPSIVVVVLGLVFGFAVQSSAQVLALRTLALRGGDMPEVRVKSEKEYVALTFSAAQPSAVVEVVAADPLPLYRTETDAKGQEAFVVSNKVDLPAGATGVLLLGWTSGGQTRYVAIKDEFAKAAYDDWLLINASARPVAFKLGDTGKPLLLKPGVSATHRISAAKGVGVAVVAQAPFEGKTKTFYSTYWPVYADKRSVVLFVDDGPKIVVKRISDQLAVPAADRKSR